MPASVQVKKHVPSGTIILNRPDKNNALSRDMLAELTQALHDLRQEREVRGVILTGAGTAFCGGRDLREMEATIGEPDAERQWHEDVIQYRELIQTMLRFPKPIVATVNGAALGSGAGLVLASDLVIAGANATLGLPEARHGLVSGIVCPLLQFRAGGATAARLVMTAAPIEATEALRLGLVMEIVETDLLWARAHEIVGVISKSAPESIQLSKRILNETIGEQLGVWMASGAAASASARTTEAATEGVRAFCEKREPEWK